MSAFLRAMDSGLGALRKIFGTTAFTLDGIAGQFEGTWNDLGRSETLEVNGRRVSFSVIAEVPRSQISDVGLLRQGMIVTRVSDGKQFRVSGEIQIDELQVRFGLDSRHK